MELHSLDPCCSRVSWTGWLFPCDLQEKWPTVHRMELPVFPELCFRSGSHPGSGEKGPACATFKRKTKPHPSNHLPSAWKHESSTEQNKAHSSWGSVQIHHNSSEQQVWWAVCRGIQDSAAGKVLVIENHLPFSSVPSCRFSFHPNYLSWVIGGKNNWWVSVSVVRQLLMKGLEPSSPSLLILTWHWPEWK